jgi:hypothetical protein
MSDYLKIWRKEHTKIQDDLSQVNQLGILSRAGQMKLQELKKELESHLINEDLNFYPALEKTAEADTDLKQELSLFAADRDKIVSEAKAFFRKAESDPMAQDIPSEFRRLSAILQGRISREENLLMKTYEKVAGL